MKWLVNMEMIKKKRSRFPPLYSRCFQSNYYSHASRNHLQGLKLKRMKKEEEEKVDRNNNKRRKRRRSCDEYISTLFFTYPGLGGLGQP